MTLRPESRASSVIASPRRSLSGRLFWLTVGIVLTTEILIFIPGLAMERHRWLTDRIEAANIALLSLTTAPGAVVDDSTREGLLRLSGTIQMQLLDSGRALLTLGPDREVTPDARVDVRTESALAGMRRGLEALFLDHDGLLLIADRSPFQPGTDLELMIQESTLDAELRAFAASFAWLSLLIAGVNGAIIYLALRQLLVLPMRRLTRSIVAFRSDPERAAPLDPQQITVLPDDEMAVAGRELASMQRALRVALGRNARLAAVGTAVAKVAHDLRNVLAPALLSAESLEAHSDASVRRSGAVMQRTLDRAVELVGQTLDFVREGPVPSSVADFCLAPLVDEAAQVIRGHSSCRVQNTVDPELKVNADRDQLFRALANLFGNAAEAGAHTVMVQLSPAEDSAGVALEVVDDGPGLPRTIQENLFRPFAGSGKPGGTGLGLAIARDLMRANGGDVGLVFTGPGGTAFRLTMAAQASRSGPDCALEENRVGTNG